MYNANAYGIRYATADDEAALARLAELDGQRPFRGPALVGEIDGAPAGAISLVDGRVVSDPFQSTAVLRQMLQIRFRALRAYARTPSLPMRLHEALRPFRARTASA